MVKLPFKGNKVRIIRYVWIGGTQKVFLERTVKKIRNGFTLIELLVVISIIALLLSVLLPSLRAAKEAAKRVVCASRMRDIGLAGQLYMTDNSKRLPYAHDYYRPPRARPTGTGPWCWPGAWAGQYIGLENYSEDRVGGRPWQDVAKKYFSCPARRRDHPELAPFDVFSYGMNIYSGMIMWGYPVRKESDIRRPSDTLMLIDVEGVENDGSNFYLTGPQEITGAPTGWIDRYAYRHRKSLNVLFFDGHVSSAKKNTKFIVEF